MVVVTAKEEEEEKQEEEEEDERRLLLDVEPWVVLFAERFPFPAEAGTDPDGFVGDLENASPGFITTYLQGSMDEHGCILSIQMHREAKCE